MNRFQAILSACSAISIPSVSSAALLGAIATSLLSPAAATAATLDWSVLNWPVGTFQQEYVVDGVTVRLTWTDENGDPLNGNPGFQSIDIDDDPTFLPNFDGGFTPGQILKVLYDPQTANDELRLTIEFLDAAGNNPVPVENVRLIVIDIDRDDTDTWQDAIGVQGSLGGNPVSMDVSPATNPPPAPPPTTPTATAADYTVDNVPAAPTTNFQVIGVYPAGTTNEADNDTSNGTIVVDYQGAIDTISFAYGNGPDSPAAPENHGIGLFNVNFDPPDSELQLVKRITNVFRNGAPLTAGEIGGNPNAVVNEAGTDVDDDLIAATNGQLPVGLTAVPSQLQSGDEVEYTVYFFNNGTDDVTDVQLCDELQPPSVYVPGSLELSTPGDLSTPLAAFNAAGPLATRDPLDPLVASCVNAPGAFPNGPPGPTDTTIGVGAGGGVLVGGAGFDVSTNSLGAFRFRVRLP